MNDSLGQEFQGSRNNYRVQNTTSTSLVFSLVSQMQQLCYPQAEALPGHAKFTKKKRNVINYLSSFSRKEDQLLAPSVSRQGSVRILS